MWIKYAAVVTVAFVYLFNIVDFKNLMFKDRQMIIDWTQTFISLTLPNWNRLQQFMEFRIVFWLDDTFGYKGPLRGSEHHQNSHPNNPGKKKNPQYIICLAQKVTCFLLRSSCIYRRIIRTILGFNIVLKINWCNLQGAQHNRSSSSQSGLQGFGLVALISLWKGIFLRKYHLYWIWTCVKSNHMNWRVS